MGSYRGQSPYPHSQKRYKKVLTETIPIIVKILEDERGQTYSTRQAMKVFSNADASEYVDILQNDYDLDIRHKIIP